MSVLEIDLANSTPQIVSISDISALQWGKLMAIIAWTEEHLIADQDPVWRKMSLPYPHWAEMASPPATEQAHVFGYCPTFYFMK